jgi:hypothetical protein
MRNPVHLIFFLFLCFNFFNLNAQEGRQTLVQALSKLETTLNKASPGASQQIYISAQGIVEEWDTTHRFKMIYDLREINLTEINIVHFDESAEASLLLVCKGSVNCVKLEEKDQRAKYFNQIYAFTLPLENQRHLADIYNLLVEIQQALPKR